MNDESKINTNKDKTVDEYPEVTIEQLILTLASSKSNTKCKSCDADNWFYTKNQGEVMKPLISTSYEDTKHPAGLSFYQRSCIDCGYIETYSRAIIKANWRRLGGVE